MKIPEYFKDEELGCPCGCGAMPDRRSVELLYAQRILLNRPMRLSSAARCEAYNKKIGGSANSRHKVGAFDVETDAGEEYETMRTAQLVGFNGLGFKDNSFLHQDRFHAASGQVWGY